MTKETLIKRTLTALSKLPKEKASEIADFADYILKKHDEETLKGGIKKLTEKSKAYRFLKDDENLYSVADLKEIYKNEKR